MYKFIIKVVKGDLFREHLPRHEKKNNGHEKAVA